MRRLIYALILTFFIFGCYKASTPNAPIEPTPSVLPPVSAPVVPKAIEPEMIEYTGTSN